MIWKASGNHRTQDPARFMLCIGVCVTIGLLCLSLVEPRASASDRKVYIVANITAIDRQTGVVTARAQGTGELYDFRVNDPGVLKTLNIGKEVHADLQTRRMFLDDQHKVLGGTIVSIRKPGDVRRP